MDNDLCNLTLLPSGKTIRVKKGDKLLQTLIGLMINLRSDCGGKGICGKCRVELVSENQAVRQVTACTTVVAGDMAVRIPESSCLSPYIIAKAPARLPQSFLVLSGSSSLAGLGIAVDLGTTTIALYICRLQTREVLASIAVKNPQALFGDDVMSRIAEIGHDQEKLYRLQILVIQAIEWAIEKIFGHCRLNLQDLARMVVVGNPTMIHIFLGVNPQSIGIAPYQPAFYEPRRTISSQLGFTFEPVGIHTLGQIAGFIGGDILAATLATALQDEPVGTLLIDLGTNGELVVKAQDGLFATSCATGPAFEGAALSCGMQATPGAIDRICLATREDTPHYSLIASQKDKRVAPQGLCGSGVVSAVAALIRVGIIDSSGRFVKDPAIPRLIKHHDDGWRYVIVPEDSVTKKREIFLSQKDIRAVQLGKAALVTGIEFLLRAVAMSKPTKVIIAGAFGSYLDKFDMLTLGMIPAIDPALIQSTGNSAGAGAIMALCDDVYLSQAHDLAKAVSVIELTADKDFQNTFVKRLSFPDFFAAGSRHR